jgi:ribosomal protein L7/L12
MMMEDDKYCEDAVKEAAETLVEAEEIKKKLEAAGAKVEIK